MELGKRLRELRLRARLTQRELAARMGLKAPLSRMLVGRLEQGRSRNPELQTLMRFLRGCGARWSELTDILDRVEPVPELVKPIQDSEFRATDKDRLARAAQQQVERYQSAMAYSGRTALLAPERQRQAALRLRNYRVTAGIIELAVEERLGRAGIAVIDWAKYKAYCRSELGRLWRLARGQKLRAADGPEWARLGLRPDLGAELAELVVARFGRLQSDCPELFAP